MPVSSEQRGGVSYLDVEMHDLMLVHVLQPSADLRGPIQQHFFRHIQSELMASKVEQVAGAIFQYHVKPTALRPTPQAQHKDGKLTRAAILNNYMAANAPPARRNGK